MIRNTRIAVLAAVLASAGAAAYAANTVENDAAAIANAKIPMTQAITVAEQHAGGKASKAEWEKTKSGWAYDVEVVSGAKVFDVKVDGATGTVIASTEDRADRDEDREARGEHKDRDGDHDRGQDHEDDDED